MNTYLRYSEYWKTFKYRHGDKIVPLLIVFILVLGLIFNIFVETQTQVAVTGKVTEKYVKRTGFGRSAKDHFHVVVQTDDGEKEIFWNDDSLFNWKFRSADLQQEMEVGKSYTFRVYGYRVPFLSWFRNIIEAKPLE